MSTPFIALAPFLPRIAHIEYQAFAPPCDDSTDLTDSTDITDVEFNSETNIWIAAVDSSGGTYAPDSKDIADALIVALQTKPYNTKIIYLLPLLGSNLAAARVPLRDALAVGIATNHNFVDGDFSQSTGLQGNGSSKYLDSLIKPSQLGTSSAGGIGFSDSNFAGGSNSEPIGSYNNAGDHRFALDIRASGNRFLSWGGPGNKAGDNVAGANADYYGQSSSTTSRQLFVDGSSVGTNTATDSTTGAGDRNIIIVGCDEAGSISPYNGRCAVAYMTDGTLSDADVADLHMLLGTYLITPTGR